MLSAITDLRPARHRPLQTPYQTGAPPANTIQLQYKHNATVHKYTNTQIKIQTYKYSADSGHLTKIALQSAVAGCNSPDQIALHWCSVLHWLYCALHTRHGVFDTPQCAALHLQCVRLKDWPPAPALHTKKLHNTLTLQCTALSLTPRSDRWIICSISAQSSAHLQTPWTPMQCFCLTNTPPMCPVMYPFHCTISPSQILRFKV